MLRAYLHTMSDTIRPITPDEVAAEQQKYIPDYVFNAFNAIIAKNWNGYSSSFSQTDVIIHILKLSNEIDAVIDAPKRKAEDKLTRQKIFDNNYLNIEKIYSLYGWNVQYRKHTMDDNGYSTYTFTKENRATR